MSKDTSCREHIANICSNIPPSEDTIVTVDEVCKAINSSKSGKSPDHHGINSEHLKFGSNHIPIMLSFLFTSILAHGYIPKNFMLSSLVPLVKNKSGDLRTKDNYRPIAMNSVLSKIFEIILFNRYSDIFSTSDYQFGFKKNLSTDMCVFMFKQVVEYYRNLSSSVYVCFLDASKAFDRVNHWVLLNKLFVCQVPLVVIRILKFWFTQQSFCVKWENATSDVFMVTNGLRQGGILSPILFNIYLDCLGLNLSASNFGCKFVDKTVNHLMYADDQTLLAPSAKGLQKLLNTCKTYANTHERVFNSKKSVFMCIEAKCLKPMHTPSLILKNDCLKSVWNYKYLSYTLTEKFCDSVAIKEQMKSIYTRANMLTIKFNRCTDDIKSKLFQAYCSNVYCSQLWWNYNSEAYKKFVVAYNNCFRRLLGYKLTCSASQMFLHNNVHHFNVSHRKSMYSFMLRIKSCDNLLVQNVYMSRAVLKSTFYKEWCNILC